MKRVYVTAYFHVPKPNLRHMEIDKYLRLIPELMRQIAGNGLVVFCEDPFISELFRRLAELNEIELTVETLSLPELPAYPAAKRLLASCERQNLDQTGLKLYKEKGHAHYWALFKGHHPSIYLKNVAIWLSKPAMVRRAIDIVSLEPEQFACWADASLAQFAYLRSGWKFAAAPLSAAHLNHYSSRMRYLRKQLPLNASFLGARKEIWERVEPRFYETLDEHLNDDYAHDEETIFGFLVRERPEWFHCLGRPYTGPFQRPRYLFRRLFNLGG